MYRIIYFKRGGSYDEKNKTAVIEQRNYFKLGDTLEFFGPDLPNTLYIVDKMVDADTNEELDVARHPLQKFKMQLPFTVHPHDMVRLIKQ